MPPYAAKSFSPVYLYLRFRINAQFKNFLCVTMSAQIEGTDGGGGGEDVFVEWLRGHGVKSGMIQKLIAEIRSVYVVPIVFACALICL